MATKTTAKKRDQELMRKARQQEKRKRKLERRREAKEPTNEATPST
jgi:hypothetical protein